MTESLRFDLLADSGSIERARETPVEIVRDHTADAHLVDFEDSDDRRPPAHPSGRVELIDDA